MVIKPTWETEQEWNWKLERSEEKLKKEPHLTFSREAVISFIESVSPIVVHLFTDMVKESERVEKPLNYLEMQLKMKGKHLEEVVE